MCRTLYAQAIDCVKSRFLNLFRFVIVEKRFTVFRVVNSSLLSLTRLEESDLLGTFLLLC